MNGSFSLRRWFDVRPGETRRFLLSFFGAFSVIAFMILARAMREALYIDFFGVRRIPNITIAIAVLSLPTVGLFGRAMGTASPRRVYSAFLVAFSGVIVALWWLAQTEQRFMIVAFYLVTALGASLLTSAFWVVTSEHYSLRQAKRLFGLIGAGGTLGAMIGGVSVGWLTDRYDALDLVPLLIGLLAAAYLLERLMPSAVLPSQSQEQSESSGLREGLNLIFGRAHLRNIAAIVFLATMASTILDYQFKEVVAETWPDREEMFSFLGAFYGWTGFISLLLQVLAVPRLMTSVGIGVNLAVLPTLLLAGSAGMFAAPGLLVATLVRGTDNTLRKSLHRSVYEYLFVPVSVTIRRKTKAFIDSVIDTTAGGVGAGILFLWITWGNLPSEYLSFFVMALSAAFIYMSVRMGAQYAVTVRDRLAEGRDTLEDELVKSQFDARHLLTMTMTRMDLKEELAKAGVVLNDAGGTAEQLGLETPTTTLERISSPDSLVVQRALEECDDWDESHVPALIRLLARSGLYRPAVDVLRTIGEPAGRALIETLLDEHADFVVRRRIPRILSEIDREDADQALLDALAAGRFEVRYRAAIALVRRRKAGLAETPGDWRSIVWQAVEREVGRDRPIWELQRILDDSEVGIDDFVGQRTQVRGELSLEHTFRQLSLVLDAEAVRMAFHGIILEDEHLKSLSLEYLEQVLPSNVRERLWPFIGDISEYQRRQSMRTVDEVVSDLSKTGATLFGSADERAALDEALRTFDSDKKKEPGAE